MKTVGHLLRAALLGFLALFTVAGLMIAAEIEEKGKVAIEAPANGGSAGSPSEQGAPGDGHPGRRAAASMFGLGLIGALIAVATALLLFVFPVGPASKIVYGLVCGPAVPMLFLAPANLARGKGGDVGAIVLLGMLLGLLVGILEANRVARERRQATAGEE